MLLAWDGFFTLALCISLRHSVPPMTHGTHFEKTMLALLLGAYAFSFAIWSFRHLLSRGPGEGNDRAGRERFLDHQRREMSVLRAFIAGTVLIFGMILFYLANVPCGGGSLEMNVSVMGKKVIFLMILAGLLVNAATLLGRLISPSAQSEAGDVKKEEVRISQSILRTSAVASAALGSLVLSLEWSEKLCSDLIIIYSVFMVGAILVYVCSGPLKDVLKHCCVALCSMATFSVVSGSITFLQGLDLSSSGAGGQDEIMTGMLGCIAALIALHASLGLASEVAKAAGSA